MKNTKLRSPMNSIRCLLRPRGKHAFLRQLPAHARILDVGCGNNSPFVVKTILPHCHYTGVDIGDHNQTKPNVADEYLLTNPEDFARRISLFVACFDAVISAHNLEHCLDRVATLEAMLNSVKPGGLLYLSFPSEGSVHLPSRTKGGALNYFDDDTHLHAPPDYRQTIEKIEQAGFSIRFCAQEYRPFVLSLVGLVQEPLSRLRNRVMQGTWALYGFESIAWARRDRQPGTAVATKPA